MTDNDDLSRILDEEIRRHPRLVAVDLVKLVYQAVFGGDHMFEHPSRFRIELEREWNALTPEDRGCDPIQIIDPVGRVARLHLKPCQETGVDVRELSDLLLRQPRASGTREAFDRLWIDVVRCAERGSIPLAADDLSRLGFPADLTHHSACYGAAAYRIINDLGHSPTRARLVGWGVLR